MTAMVDDSLLACLEKLNDIGVALSSERQIECLLEKILVAAKDLTCADGGTLYLAAEDGQGLHFAIMHNDSLGLKLGGTSGRDVGFADLPFRDHHGQANDSMVAVYAALHASTVNIEDAYQTSQFDFSGTQAFDQRTGYRSRSFLTVPLKNHEAQVIGVLQLINAQAADRQGVQVFTAEDQSLVESLASQAAIALTNRQLINQLEALFESFIGLINLAIDEKSPYTRGHCERVPVLTMMLAEAVNSATYGTLADFYMNEKDFHELRIAGLLHDCGKITTPIHVVDKATKLQTLFDRINLLDTRCEVLLRDAEINFLQQKIAVLEKNHTDQITAAVSYSQLADLQADHIKRCRQIRADREFLRHINTGSEFMSDEAIQRLQTIQESYLWTDTEGKESHLLTADEFENLNIRAGTLTAAERQIINHHIVATIRMLEALPWPDHLKRVPEYAGGHHERMDGKGYPKGLHGHEMTVQTRIMAIADIFEALTARDRPYKPGKKLSESLQILSKFAQNGHIDPEIFKVFITEHIYLQYAKKFLQLEQIDLDEHSDLTHLLVA